MGHAETVTKSLCAHIENIVVKNNRPYNYIFTGDEVKGTIAKNLLDENPCNNGVVCILSSVGVCSAMTVIKNRTTKKLELK